MSNEYCGIRTFLKAPIGKYTDSYDVAIIGCPYDMGTTYRSGSRFGPASIREASIMLTDGDHPIFETNPMINLKILDMGDIELSTNNPLNSYIKIEHALDQLNHYILLGGDHSITYNSLVSKKKKHGEFALLHFDAHGDCWEGTGPYGLDHGSFLRKAIENNVIDPKNILQFGIRSPEPKEIKRWRKDKGINSYSVQDIRSSGLQWIINLINDKFQDIPVYLTLDIDCLDCSVAPGTGTPEIGGFQSHEVQRILQNLDLNYIGMDIVEVSPPYDISNITSLAAATFVWEYLNKLCVL